MMLLEHRETNALLDLENEIINDYNYFITSFSYTEYQHTPLILYSASFSDIKHLYFDDSFYECLNYISNDEHQEDYADLDEDEQYEVEDMAHGFGYEFSYDDFLINTLTKHNIFHIISIDYSNEEVGYANYKITNSPIQEVW